MITEMLISEILKLPSVDSDGSCYPGDSNDHDWSVPNALEKLNVDSRYYDTIRAEMEYDRYNRVPIHVGPADEVGPFYFTFVPERFLDGLMMGNGHNRLKIMIELGFTHARVTDDPYESDDTNDPKYTRPEDTEDDDDGWW